MRIDREVLAKHQALEHRESGLYLRHFIFGVEDGLIGCLGLITGVSIATFNQYLIILSGVALMFTQAVSMGVGTYLSVKSHREVYDQFLEKEKREMKEVPEVEREEVRQIYRAHGFEGKELESIVKKITSNTRTWLSVMMTEEYGLSKKGLEKPGTATLIMILSVMLGAFIPLFPYFFLAPHTAIFASIIATIIGLFVFGATKTIFTERGWAKSGLEMLAIGLLAAGAGYVIGELFSAFL